MIEMTEEGFYFLAMGFTGREAARFKVAFINAFSRMRQALASQITQAQAALPETLTAEDFEKLLARPVVLTGKEYLTLRASAANRNPALHLVAPAADVPKEKPYGIHHKLTRSEKLEIGKLADKGFSGQAIADRLERNQSTICRYLRKRRRHGH